ncbi:MAG: hypothetical protein ABI672_17585 [Vicinamibacteria bacterium]
MSLILEALRKLDRDKQVPERGFLVLAQAPWPSSSRIRTPHIVFGVAVAMSLGAGLAYWFLRPAPQVVPTPASTALVPAIPVPAPVEARRAPASVPGPGTRLSQPPPPPRTAVKAATPIARPLSKAPDPAVVEPQAPESAPAVQHLVAPYVLQALSSLDGHPVAVINGLMVREGEVIDGVTILKIGTETVEMEVAGLRRVLRF